MSAVSNVANACCQGSHRKLIAGIWYFILLLALGFCFICAYIVASKPAAEAFSTFWVTMIFVAVVISGTITMRSVHSSLAIGLFVGSVVGTANLFFLMFLIYIGYAEEQSADGEADGPERVLSIFCLIISGLLGLFAYILGTHRGEVLAEASRKASVELSKSSSSNTSSIL